MRERKRSAKPTVRTADLPFQSKGRRQNFIPREKWSKLELSLWREQQKVAVRLRRLRKRLQNWKKAFGASVGLPHTLASLGLRARFVRGDADRITPLDAAIVQREDVELQSTIARRAVQVAYSWIDRYLSLVPHYYAVFLGRKCGVCSGRHATDRCLELLEREVIHELEHIVRALDRLALVLSESDRVDDVTRIAVSRRRVEQLTRQRAVALARIGWYIATYGLRASGGSGLIRILRLTPALVNDLWYVISGSRYSELDLRPSRVFNHLWQSRTLIEFMEEEQARSTVSVTEVEATFVPPSYPVTMELGLWFPSKTEEGIMSEQLIFARQALLGLLRLAVPVVGLGSVREIRALTHGVAFAYGVSSIWRLVENRPALTERITSALKLLILCRPLVGGVDQLTDAGVRVYGDTMYFMFRTPSKKRWQMIVW